jgi:hypothetical protein
MQNRADARLRAILIINNSSTETTVLIPSISCILRDTWVLKPGRKGQKWPSVVVQHHKGQEMVLVIAQHQCSDENKQIQ